VHSVFAHAVNLQADFGICTLLYDTALRPNSVLLSENPYFQSWPLHDESLFFLSPEKIWTDDPAQGLCVELIPAKAIDLRLRRPANKGFIGGLEQKMDIIAKAVFQSGRHEGLAPLLCNAPVGIHAAIYAVKENPYSLFLRPKIDCFCRVMEQNDLAAIRRAAAGIAGCGPGLTPSADDFILGFICVWSLGETGGAFTQAKIDAAALEAVKHTGSISAAFLRHCAQGLYSLDILQFAEALQEDTTEPPGGDPAGDNLRAACEKVLQFGAASGADFLCGAFYALMSRRPAV